MNRRSSSVLSMLLLCGPTALLGACRADPFARAARADSSDAYRRYLRENPDDEEVVIARERLAELEFERAARTHSIVAYKRFLEEFPDVVEANAARSRLEALRFNAARSTGTPEALRQFLRDHPSGEHRAAALAALASLEGGPASAASPDPLQRRDDAEFEAARKEGAKGYHDYLDQHPAGSFRREAQTALFGLRLAALVHSGELSAARAALATSPLATEPLHREFEERLQSAEREAALVERGELAYRKAHARHYLRALDDLISALDSPDPLIQWQAAEELSQHVSVRAVEALIRALRSARNPLVRVTAFDSLRVILGAFPRPLVEYEVWTRLRTLEGQEADGAVSVVIAALHELLGNEAEASAHYRSGLEPLSPDPLVLLRVLELHRGQGRYFSAAVAARQLATWAARVSTSAEGELAPAVPTARLLCAAARFAARALEVIREARGHPTEFPKDLNEFEGRAHEARALAQARLADAELALQGRDASFRTCADSRVRERLDESERLRADALRALARRGGAEARTLLAAAAQRDPAPALRELARGLLR